MPRICFSWLVAMIKPVAVINPAMTGRDKKFARKPSLKIPMAMRNSPEMNAKVKAAVIYSAVPCSAIFPMAAAVINDISATGPTASARLVPKIAYNIIGTIEAYMPISAGNPANNA